MQKRSRYFIALLILLVIVAFVLGVDAIRQKQFATLGRPGMELPAGSVPIYLDGQLAAGFVPDDLEKLEMTSFVDAAEEKSQDGWLLADIIRIYIDPEELSGQTKVIVSSTSRGKTIELTWEEVKERANMVMFDLSNRGTLKLVSLLPKLDTREEWIQDVDKIEIIK